MELILRGRTGGADIERTLPRESEFVVAALDRSALRGLEASSRSLVARGRTRCQSNQSNNHDLRVTSDALRLGNGRQRESRQRSARNRVILQRTPAADSLSLRRCDQLSESHPDLHPEFPASATSRLSNPISIEANAMSCGVSPDLNLILREAPFSRAPFSRADRAGVPPTVRKKWPSRRCSGRKLPDG